MKTTTLALQLSDDVVTQIDNRCNATALTRPDQVAYDLQCFYMQEIIAHEELRSTFTLDELVSIWNHAQGQQFHPALDVKSTLLNELQSLPYEDESVLRAVGELPEAAQNKAMDALKECMKDDRELRANLLEKIKSLSSFQAYVLYSFLARFGAAYPNGFDANELQKAFHSGQLSNALPRSV